MKVLIVLTSHGELGDTGKPTGFWLEELAAPYLRFRDAGADVTLASPKGGRPPVDPASEASDAQTDATRRFTADTHAQAALDETRPLADVAADEFDAVFFPGGHGPLWDLASDPAAIRVTEAFARLGKPIAAVCHGPAVFRAVTGADGKPLVAGRRVTGFSDAEEAAVGLTEAVPFSIEQVFRDQGAEYISADAFTPLAVADGKLITGQNPQSSEQTADRLLEAMGLVAAEAAPAEARAVYPG